MLFLHELHYVHGRDEEAFEALYRDQIRPKIATDDQMRLAWYLRSTHGAGEGYTALSVIALADFAAWNRLIERMLRGDLADDQRRADHLRYRATSTLQLGIGDATPELADIPIEATERGQVMVRQDTLIPRGNLDELVRASSKRSVTAPWIEAGPAFVPALALGSPQLTKWHRIIDTDAWMAQWTDHVEASPGGVDTFADVRAHTVRTFHALDWSPLA